jgi:hypothetical protein
LIETAPASADGAVMQSRVALDEAALQSVVREMRTDSAAWKSVAQSEHMEVAPQTALTDLRDGSLSDSAGGLWSADRPVHGASPVFVMTILQQIYYAMVLMYGLLRYRALRRQFRRIAGRLRPLLSPDYDARTTYQRPETAPKIVVRPTLTLRDAQRLPTPARRAA